MDLLVERLAADFGSWRRLRLRVEARRHELYPPAPPRGLRDEEGRVEVNGKEAWVE